MANGYNQEEISLTRVAMLEQTGEVIEEHGIDSLYGQWATEIRIDMTRLLDEMEETDARADADADHVVRAARSCFNLMAVTHEFGLLQSAIQNGIPPELALAVLATTEIS